MIHVKFDPYDPVNPTPIPGSLTLTTDDLKDGPVLANRLREATGDPLSAHLNGSLSAETRQLLDPYDGSAPLPEPLREALLVDLNRALSGPSLYERRRFRGMTWEREKLIPELIKLGLTGDALLYFNRLLLEEVYPDEIERSPRVEWGAWNVLAAAATKDVIGQWETWKVTRAAWKQQDEASRGPAPLFDPKFNDDVWKGFRDWLLAHVFNDKCAYCETEVAGYPGDAEHFRPKGRVRVTTDEDDSEIIKVLDEGGEEMQHPGYFWLAYHWQNLLPSCEFCNRFGGKQDLFPVKSSHVAVRRLTAQQEIDDLIENLLQSMSDSSVYYLQPKDLDRLENRLLLHPYYENPELHLIFDTGGRAAEWLGSERGKVSKTIYNLNQPKKVARRRKEQLRGLRLYQSKLGSVPDDADEIAGYRRAARELKDEYYGGSRPYAVAVFDFIHDRLEDTDMDPDALLGERRAEA